MSEWWTYSLSDFLMFSARTYYRQFELMNRELWPLPLVLLAAGGVLVACLLRRSGGARRIGYLLLGTACLWVGWAYHAQRYADINTGAPYFAAAFGLQGVLLLGMAAWGAGQASRDADVWDARLGLGAVILAWFAFPLLAPLAGRGWWQAEVAGLAPDPTALATLGALLFWRAPWLLWVVPVLWCLASSATLNELRAPLAWLPAGGAVVLVVASAANRVRRS